MQNIAKNARYWRYLSILNLLLRIPKTPKAGPYPQKNTIYCVFGADYNNILRLMAAKCVIGIKIGIIFRIYQLLNRALIFIFVRVPQ